MTAQAQQLKKKQDKERNIRAKQAIVSFDIQSDGQMTIKEIRKRLKVLSLN